MDRNLPSLPPPLAPRRTTNASAQSRDQSRSSSQEELLLASSQPHLITQTRSQARSRVGSNASRGNNNSNSNSNINGDGPLSSSYEMQYSAPAHTRSPHPRSPNAVRRANNNNNYQQSPQGSYDDVATQYSNDGQFGAGHSTIVDMPQASRAPYMQQQQHQSPIAAPAFSSTEQQRLTRVVRKKTVKRVELFRGNLVINCPVPDKLTQNVPFKDVEEVAMMRYTAVTGEPDDFIRNNFTLRQQLYNRQTELFIVMTMVSIY